MLRLGPIRMHSLLYRVRGCFRKEITTIYALAWEMG